MAKAPTARGFTLAEKRSLQFENVALYAVFLVAIIAASISFIALKAVGADAGLGRASFLLPLAIDGFGIACSVGIIKSVAEGEGFRDRASEWFGLFSALALSILGNVHHALEVGAASLPDYVKIAYATAIPLIVAYGIHVYGRAMSKGISAHVLADDPDKLRFDLEHLGGESGQRRPAQARAPRTPKVAPSRAAAPSPARTTPAQPTPERAQPAAPEVARTTPTPSAAPQGDEQAAAQVDEKARARAIFDRMVAENPVEKPDAAKIHAEADVQRDKATSRRWVQTWWNEVQSQLGIARDELPSAQPAGTQEGSERVA